MAKAKEKTTKKVAAPAVVTIKDLEKEFGVEGRKIRILIRGLGLKAPEVKQEGFGPKAKYEWAADSKELAKIRKAIKDSAAAASKKAEEADADDEDEDGEDEE